MSYTRVEVEPNANTPMAATQVFKNIGTPHPVSAVRLFEGEPEGRLFDVTGWSSAEGGSPVSAYAVQVEDSSAGAAWLVYGGDWGIRLRPTESLEDWSLEDPDQYGETHLVLADEDDIMFAD
ncbi:MAG TPA: hypothetical protein VNN10_06645 [Dehalococcoidia bacterium]|nr:hypothetical protein [Dehalococcoidia bacterium]